MFPRRFRGGALLSLALAACSLLPAALSGQIPDVVEEAAEDAAEDQLADEVRKLVRNSVHCVFDDLECIRSSKEEGESVVLTDEDGNVIYDDEGNPVQSQDELPPEKREEAAQAEDGGGVATAESDFQRGERRILVADYADDVPGDFPRNLEYLGGNTEVATADGMRVLEILEEGRFALPLPETLPDRFTLEMPVHVPGVVQELRILTAMPPENDLDAYSGHLILIDTYSDDVGLEAWNHDVGGSLSDPPDSMVEGFVPLQLMVDGEYAKVYLDGQRISNVPRASLPRGDALYFQSERASEEAPVFVGPVRVHAGGRDLYDALEDEGRVAVDDILFATDRAEIKAESAEILEEIASMLREHADLQLLIEGHTDDRGGFQHNMELSKRRAEAVKRYLAEELGIDAGRLQTMGLGQTRPVAGNDTSEGRQQNRRVELVRVDG